MLFLSETGDYMREKRVFYSELAYVIGIIVLAFGTALLEKADFGMSMIVAPAYLLHLKISPYIPFFSFGVAEYVFQGFLLVLLSIVLRKIKFLFFLSFVTAFIYGNILNLFISLISFIPFEGIVFQIVFFVLGAIICSFGVSLLFHTYFPPEAYELVVKEFSQKYNTNIGKTKTIYDFCSCALAVVLSLCFFGGFVGIGVGTFICAIVNGWLIGKFSNLLDKYFNFKDALSLRKIIY